MVPSNFTKLLSLLILMLFLSACSSKYNYIPRTFHFSKTKISSNSHNGHFVKNKLDITVTENALRYGIDSFETHLSTPTNLSSSFKKSSLIPSHGTVVKSKNHIAVTDSLTRDTTESIHSDKVDKSLFKDSNVLFAVGSAANISYLLLAELNFFAISLLIGIGLVILMYFGQNIVQNIVETRSKPQGPIRGFNPKRDSAKKAFKLLMVIAGTLFTLALLIGFLTFFEGVAIALAVFGVVAFNAAILSGLAYLVMSI